MELKIGNEVKQVYKLMDKIIAFLLIFLGVSAILFIIRLMWAPPNSLGMMMGKKLILQHMSVWLLITIMFLIFLLLLLFLIKIIFFKKKKHK